MTSFLHSRGIRIFDYPQLALPLRERSRRSAPSSHLNGTVTLSRRDGNPVGSFGIKTSWALGDIAGGQDSARMSWQDEEFAKKLAQELVERRDAKP